MKKVILTACIITFLIGTTKAGPLDKSVVSPDAKWFAHIDITRLHSSTIWQLIEAAPKAKNVVEKIEAMKSFIGFDPVSDLSDITLYGNCYKQGEGTVILKGRIPAAHLTELIASTETHTQIAYGPYLLHSWIEKKKNNKQVQGCILDGSTMIFASSMEELKAAIDIVANGAQSLADDADSATSDLSNDAMILFHTKKMNGGCADNPHANITKSIECMTFTADETDSRLDMKMRIQTDSGESAVQLRQMIDGMVAFISKSGEKNPDAAALARDITRTIDNDVVSLGLSRSAEEFYAMMKRQHERKGRARGEWKKRGRSSKQQAVLAN